MSDTGIVNIRGKEYKTVALRVQEFRKDHPDWGILTEIIHQDDNHIVMRAQICNDKGAVAVGHAEEVRSASGINETSALEVCETSAVGRALAFLGYGGSELCSADELVAALTQQEQLWDKDEGISEVTQRLLKDRDTVKEWKPEIKTQKQAHNIVNMLVQSVAESFSVPFDRESLRQLHEKAMDKIQDDIIEAGKE